jgi:hypothetical protein
MLRALLLQKIMYKDHMCCALFQSFPQRLEITQALCHVVLSFLDTCRCSYLLIWHKKNSCVLLSSTKGGDECSMCSDHCFRLNQSLEVMPCPTGSCTTPPNNASISNFSTRNNYTTMAPIDEAIADLKLCEAGDNFSLRCITKKHGVSHSKLSQRWNHQTGPWAAGYTAQQLLSPQQEERLVEYIGGLTARGLPPTRAMI